MQVRIDDEIDFVRFYAALLQPVEEIRVHVVPARNSDAPLPIADAGIDDDRLARNHDQECLHQPLGTAHLVNKVGCQPCRTGDSSRIELGNESLKRGRGVHFPDTKNRGITHVPAQRLHAATVA